jgi:hypothetical protein
MFIDIDNDLNACHHENGEQTVLDYFRFQIRETQCLKQENMLTALQ